MTKEKGAEQQEAVAPEDMTQPPGTSAHVAPPVDEAGPVPEGGAPPYPPETADEANPVSPFAPVWEGGDPNTPEPPEIPLEDPAPDAPVEDEELPDDD